MDFLIVGLGGFLGARARYGIFSLEKKFYHTFPVGTLAINVSGCFFAGILLSILGHKTPAFPHLHLLLIVGFLGSYTTFSTFSVETLSLAQGNFPLLSVANILLNLVLGIAAVGLGRKLAMLL